MDPFDVYDSMVNGAFRAPPIDPMMDAIAAPAAVAPRKKKKKKSATEKSYDLNDDQEGIVKSLVNTTMSGLGYVADSLDKLGGRQVRGFLGGQPRELLSILPFSDALGVTRAEDIVSGGDLIGTRGKPGLHNRLMEFGAEVLLDPTTYFTLGASAIGKGGKAVKTAGLSDELVAAGKAANMGRREARMSMSARDVVNSTAGDLSPAEKMEQFRRAVAGAEKTDASNLSQNLLDEYLDQKIGGTINVGLPFTEGTVLGTGGRAKVVAKKLDDLQARAGDSFLGRWGKQLFSAPVMGAFTSEGQEVGRQLHKGLRTAKEKARYAASQYAHDLKAAGKTTADDASELRQAAEMRTGTDSTITNVANQMRSSLQDLLYRSQDIGIPIEKYRHENHLMEYFPRFMTSQFTKSGKRRLHNAFDPSQLAREEYLKNWTGPDFRGTESIRDVIMDPEIGDRIEQLQAAGVPNLHDDIAETIKQAYGPNVIGGDSDMQDFVSRKMAALMIELGPDGRTVGGFGNHPVADWMRRTIAGEEAYTRAKTVLDYLGENKNLFATSVASAKGAKGTKTISLKDFMEEIGSYQTPMGKSGGGKLRLDLGDENKIGAMDYVSGKLGISKDDFKDLHIDRDLADDFVRFLETPTNPKEISRIIDAIDSYTSLFKAGVLTRPSRFTRDFTSGIYQNYLIGAANAKDYKHAWDLIHGKEIDVTDVPVIRDALNAKGVPITRENALNEFKSLVASLDLADANTMAPNLVQSATPVSREAESLDDILSMAPGNKPVSFRKMAKEAIPRSKDQWNPFNIRGVGIKDVNKRVETTFAPAKWGENMGSAVEAMNRISPFLTMLRKGVDPQQARLKVLAAHSEYAPEAFTTFEREYLARVFPFYRFTRKQIPFHIQQIMEQPGGKLGKTLRGINTMRDRESPLPEHIGQTAAIPIDGAQEGYQRFVTGFGLPLEDVFGLFRPGANSYKTAKGTLQEFYGRLNPLIKAPSELASGTQMFTGRDLEDLRGSLSDIIYNTGLVDSAPDTPILLEHVLSNSPVSGILTQVRQMLDKRKGVGAKAVNLATGIRTTDTDLEKSRNLAIRQTLEDLLRQDPKVHRFSHLFAPDEELLSPRNKQLMDLYQLLGAKSAAESRKRKKEAAAAAAVQ